MITDLTRTDFFIAPVVEALADGAFVVRSPHNPTYRWGNYLFLPERPDLEALPELLERFSSLFGDAPVSRALRWDGEPLADLRGAQALGLVSDSGVAMAASALREVDGPAEIRPAPYDQAVEALAVACDPTEQLGEPGFVAFKQGLRSNWRRLFERGDAQWWQAFVGGRPVGQCGMVLAPDGRARFQSVEVHPDFRKRGIASQLVSRVGRLALEQRATLHMAVDGEGPALGLYRRLGFEVVGHQWSLLETDSEVAVRDEQPGDVAEVRSVLVAAFGQADEARIAEGLRTGGAGVRVAERDGRILGVCIVSDVALAGGCGLGPIAVRPSAQREGIGGLLVEDAVREARERGRSWMVVLGDPAYYGRFGFESAERMTCRWDVPQGALQVRELAPGGLEGHTGRVGYSPAFGPA